MPRDAAERTYRDENHKPELIVAISDTFTALAGLRDLDATRRLVAALGAGAARAWPRAWRGRMPRPRSATRSRGCSPEMRGRDVGRDRRGRGRRRTATEFARGADLVAAPRRATIPGDPRHRRGAADEPGDAAPRRRACSCRRACCTPTSRGLGVELMAASDNVLRGGLTPKHIDVDELLRVLDPTPGPAPVRASRGPRRRRVALSRPDVPGLRPHARRRRRRRARATVPISTGSRSRWPRRAR